MSIDIMPLGDRAMLINFPQLINPEIHQQVMTLAVKIENSSTNGVTFILPAYCSLTIGYDPALIRYRQLKEMAKELLKHPTGDLALDMRSITVPVCYQEPFALDILELSKDSGLSPKDIVNLHVSGTYRVYMLGFLPGFPYLGILPSPLQFPRRKTPRLKVPERSVGIAGQQTGIYPSASPGGWNILGSTPLPVFNPQQENPFLFKTGDEVKFESISIKEHRRIQQEVELGTFNWTGIYG